MRRSAPGGRLARGLLVLLLAACSSGTSGDPRPAATAPASSSPPLSPVAVPVVDWGAIPSSVDLGSGWSAGSCGGDAPYLCIRRDGRVVGTVELFGVPVATYDLPGFEEALGRSDHLGALRILVADYYTVVKQDRLAGFGAGYAVETEEPEKVDVSGGDGLRYGFTGTAGGAVDEQSRSYVTIRDGEVWTQAAGAVSPSSMADGEIQFTAEQLAELAPLLDRVVARTVLPEGADGS